MKFNNISGSIFRTLLRPQVIILALTLILLWRIIILGRLVYGDIPFFDVGISKINFLYTWGPEQLGTNVRQSLNTLRDQLFYMLSWSDSAYYFMKYVLPIVCIPVTYYYLLRNLGIRKKPILIGVSLFPLFTPIVYGDFLNGQTFWVYLTVPWVIYFAIKLFMLHEFTIKNSLLLGLFMFLSLGMLPPIIVPLAALLTILVITSAILSIQKQHLQNITKYLVYGFISVVIFVSLSVPYLFAASSGQSAFTPASLLGDYYNNYSDTSLINTFRGSGNNGSGQKTLNYNVSALSNAAGYTVLLVIMFGAFVALEQRRYRELRTTVVVLVPMLAIVGFMHLMSTDPVFGVKVFESQWIVSTIRNPSKLYVLILPCLVIMLALAMQTICSSRYYHNRRFLMVAGSVLAVMTLIYGWPTLRGDLGLFYGREHKVQSYKPNDSTISLAKNTPSTERSIIAPSDHDDELNYQNVNPAFNVLRLEGGAPSTTSYVSSLKKAFNDKNRYFFNYAANAGVENLFLKNDPSEYATSRFGLFGLSLSPEESRAFANSGMERFGSDGTYTYYKNPRANSLVYSPDTIVEIKNDNTLKAKAPFLGKNVLVTDGATFGGDIDQYKNSYLARHDLKFGDEVGSGLAQLEDPRLLRLTVNTKELANSKQISIEIIDPITKAPTEIRNLSVAKDASVLTIGNENYSLTEKPQSITARSGENKISVSSVNEIKNAGKNFSFENGALKAGDARPEKNNSPTIYSKTNDDHTEGRKSLELGAKNHKAFASIDIPVDCTQGRTLVRFDTKNLTGKPSSYALTNSEGDTISYGDNSGGGSQSDGWTGNEVYVNGSEIDNCSGMELYLYTESIDDTQSVNLFDNVRIYKVNELLKSEMTFESYEPDYRLTNYTVTEKNIDTGNLIANGSFEAGAWGVVGDATAGAKGRPKVYAKISDDSVDGGKSLGLGSNNHTAYMSKKIQNFKNNSVYKFSLAYKNVSGRSPSVAVWQNGKNISSPKLDLKEKKGEWSRAEVTFVPDEKTTDLTVYLYSPSNGENTYNLFDDLKIERTSSVSTYLQNQSSATRTPDQIVKSFNRLSPVEITANASKGAGAIVFNESYQKGWVAYAVPKNYKLGIVDRMMLREPGIRLIDHQRVNGFANGWWVDSNNFSHLLDDRGEYKIVLRYEPQKKMFIGLIISAIVAIVLALYFIRTLIHRRNSRYVSK